MSSAVYIFLVLNLAVVTPSIISPFFPLKLGNCHFPSLTTELNKEQFFNKKWYVWKSSGNYFFSLKSSCAGMDTRMVGNETEFLHFQYETLLNSFVSIKGRAQSHYLKYKGLVFPINYSAYNYNFSLTLSIADTDYDNWAAIYFCRQLIGSKIEMSWLLTTDWKKTPTEEQQKQMSEAISSFDYTLDDYLIQDNSHCGGYEEPHL